MTDRDFESAPGRHLAVVDGSDHKPTWAYAAIFAGLIMLLGLGLYTIGTFTSPAGLQANGPAVETTGQRASVPGAGSAGQAVPGGNWDKRLNRDEGPSR